MMKSRYNFDSRFMSTFQNSNYKSNSNSKNGAFKNKRFSNITQNGFKAPLEVINENQCDLSKTSINEAKSSNGMKKSQATSENELPKNGKRSPPKRETSRSRSKNRKHDKNLNDESQISQVDDKQVNQSNAIIQSNNKANTARTKINKDSVRNWRNINITSIISENKLLNAGDSKFQILLLDDVLFQGEIRKFMNHQIKTHASQMYTIRFCVVTRTELKYYKSKESFLTMLKPLNIIPLFQIKEVGLVPGKTVSKFCHFYIKLHEIYKSDLNITNRNFANESSNSYLNL